MCWSLPISAKMYRAAVATFPFWSVLSAYELYSV